MGKSTAHAGFGITVAGIAGLMAWQSEDIRVAQVGETTVSGYEVTLTDDDAHPAQLRVDDGHMDVHKDGKLVASLTPEKRVYPVQAMPTTEAAIAKRLLARHLPGDRRPAGRRWLAVRTFIKPLPTGSGRRDCHGARRAS
ncbi:MAG: cytochrome c-type biogenesis CcmF C-terminal domain-containing protein [Paracoccaceae bacterium]